MPSGTVKVGFEDPDFLGLCRLVQDVNALRAGEWAHARDVLGQLVHVVRLVRAVLRLPRVAVAVTASPSGRLIRAYLGGGPRIRRPMVGISVLTLPGDVEEYRRGRSRQAFRTNCARARRNGVQVVVTDDDEAVRIMMDDLFLRRDDADGGAWYFRRAEAHEGQFWFALDAEGGTLALCEVIVDGRAALLRSMISAPGADRSTARFLLMGELLASLIERDVRHLVVDRVFSLTPGLVYFQRLLGFVPVNLTFADSGPAWAYRRRHVS